MSKKLIVISFLLVIGQSVFSQQRNLTVKDSINIVYDSLFYHLESRYLHSEKVNWKKLKPYIREKALKASNLKEAFDFTMVELFDTIKGKHLNLFSNQGWYKSSLGREFTRKDFSNSFLEKYESKHGFETKILDKKYGYVLIPGMLLDVSQDSINKKTQQMYDAITYIAKKKEIKGWVIDLRMNIGGNVFPMLAALHYFLGDNTAYTMISKDNSITQIHVLKNGAIYEEGILRAKANLSIKANEKIPVVFVTGIMTGSAGELIPVSFRGRRNVKIVGETTYGLLSGNDLTKLPFGAKITLTTGYLADRKGKYTPKIVPDIMIHKKDNYTDLMQDENIKEALKFIESKQ